MSEEVEVVGYRYSVCGDLLLDHCKPSLPHDQLMTVAQHQRIVEQLEKDSARYRWLRCRTTTERITILSRYQYDADMDAAIDAAMAGVRTNE